MITVTAQAAEELKAVLQAQVTDPEAVIRMVPTQDGQLALALDTVKEGDQVVEHAGVKVLVVGAELTDAVEGLVLDCTDTPEGRQLGIFKRSSGT